MADEPTGQNGPSSSSATTAGGSGKNDAGGPDKPSADPPKCNRFGEELAPILLQSCGDQLVNLRWFRTDWQRGGALTGYADFIDDAGSHPVVVKYPVPPRELRWMRRLQDDQHEHGQVVPKLYASGDMLGGYDLAWVVMQRLPHGPLSGAWEGKEFDLIIEAAGRFYAAADRVPVDEPGRTDDWSAILKRARKALRAHSVNEEQRWNKALKALGKKLDKTLAVWDARDANHWCHGDLHLGNAMTCDEPPAGPAVLFDLANVRAGHWVEDAVYLEHLFWSVPERLGGRSIVKQVAHERKSLGLNGDGDWPQLAWIRRALLAAAVPAYLKHEGNPRHVLAALERLEQALGQLPS